MSTKLIVIVKVNIGVLHPVAKITPKAVIIDIIANHLTAFLVCVINTTKSIFTAIEACAAIWFPPISTEPIIGNHTEKLYLPLLITVEKADGLIPIITMIEIIESVQTMVTPTIEKITSFSLLSDEFSNLYAAI
jgi:hypothetical protein